MEIKQDDLSGKKIVELLMDHLNSMTSLSPPESVHALNLEGLKNSEVTFWSVWIEDELLGCGALKELDPSHGEIKSMKTAKIHMRKGVARKMLHHIVEEAKHRGYKRLFLETGSLDAFIPARNLYKSMGFQYCEPFSDYKEDPNSVFMTMELS
jgi:putative acetyltransferase